MPKRQGLSEGPGLRHGYRLRHSVLLTRHAQGKEKPRKGHLDGKRLRHTSLPRGGQGSRGIRESGHGSPAVQGLVATWGQGGGRLDHFLNHGMRKPDFASKQVAEDSQGVGLTVQPEVSAHGDAPATTGALLPLHKRRQTLRPSAKKKKKLTKTRDRHTAAATGKDRLCLHRPSVPHQQPVPWGEI